MIGDHCQSGDVAPFREALMFMWALVSHLVETMMLMPRPLSSPAPPLLPLFYLSPQSLCLHLSFSSHPPAYVCPSLDSSSGDERHRQGAVTTTRSLDMPITRYPHGPASTESQVFLLSDAKGDCHKGVESWFVCRHRADEGHIRWVSAPFQRTEQTGKAFCGTGMLNSVGAS